MVLWLIQDLSATILLKHFNHVRGFYEADSQIRRFADSQIRRFADSQIRRFAFMALSIASLGCGNETEVTTTSISSSLSEDIYARPEELPVKPPLMLAYRRIQTESSTLPPFVTESGEITDVQKYTTISPSISVFTDPANFVHEDVEVTFDSFGRSTSIVSYWRDLEIENAALPLPVDNRPLVVDQLVWDQIRRSELDERIFVLVKVKGVPFWNIPQSVQNRGYDAFSEATLEAARAQTISNRELEIERLSSDLISWAVDNDVKIVKQPDLMGWMRLDLPVQQFTDLVSRSDLRRVAIGWDDGTDDNCNPSCSQPSRNWPLGLGRANSRVGVDRFIDAGYDGWRSNSGFHDQSRLNVAVMEKAGEANWNDEARLLNSAGVYGSRVTKRQRCVSTGCDNRTNMANVLGGDSHPNNVMSVVVGDLEDAQGENSVMGDACFLAPDHCVDWREMGSGMAPEAQVQMWAGVNNDERHLAIYEALFEDSGDFKPDVINLSSSWWDCETGCFDPNGPLTGCNATSSLPDEDWFEIAYLNGVLIVNGPRNQTPSGLCNLDSPGDIPATLTVGALAASTSTCNLYGLGNCSLNSTSPLGGVDIDYGGVTPVPGAMSGIDLVAPGAVSFFGSNTAGDGVISTSTASGTSIAAPHVAGAAIDLKDWALSNGQTWINSAGRLHTMMLGMTDRDVNGTRLTSGADDRWGLGKLRMRQFSDSFFAPAGYSMQTRTLVSTGTTIIKAFTNPMPSSGVDFVKCVLQEDEFFMSKDDASDVTLRVTISEPVNGLCTTSTSGTTKSDYSYDLKHMVSFDGATTTLNGKCITVQLPTFRISTAGETTVHAFCYYSGKYDYE